MLGGNDKQHLYHNSTLALDADTGKIVWYYQHVVDHWDLDHPFERLLVDTAVAPDPSEVAWINPKMQAGRAAQGHHRHPRQDRHRLHARSRDRRVPLGAADRDAERRQHDRRRDRRGHRRTPRRCSRRQGQTKLDLPGHATAARTGRPARTARTTNTMYYPAAEHVHERDDDDRTRATRRRSTALNMPGMHRAGHRQRRQRVGDLGRDRQDGVEARAARRHDVARRRPAAAWCSAATRTAASARSTTRTGKVLWEVNLGSPVSGFPVTFAVDGKQYVAVTTGPSLVAGSDNRVAPELKPSNAANVFVFALP